MRGEISRHPFLKRCELLYGGALKASMPNAAQKVVPNNSQRNSGTATAKLTALFSSFRELMRGGSNSRCFFDWAFPRGPKIFSRRRSFIRQGCLKARFRDFSLFLFNLDWASVRERSKQQRDRIFVTPIQYAEQRTNLHAQSGFLVNFSFQCLNEGLASFYLAAWQGPKLRSRSLTD